MPVKCMCIWQCFCIGRRFSHYLEFFLSSYSSMLFSLTFFLIFLFVWDIVSLLFVKVRLLVRSLIIVLLYWYWLVKFPDLAYLSWFSYLVLLRELISVGFCHFFANMSMSESCSSAYFCCFVSSYFIILFSVFFFIFLYELFSLLSVSCYIWL